MATRKTKKTAKGSQKTQLSTLMEMGEQPTPLMLLNSKDEYQIGH